MTTADLATGTPGIAIEDVSPVMPRGPAMKDRALLVFVVASLIVHAAAFLPSLLRPDTAKAAAPKEIAVEIVQEKPKPDEKQKQPKAPQAKQEVPKQEVAKQDAPKQQAAKQQPPKQQTAKKEPARQEAPKKEAAKQPAPKEAAHKEAARQAPRPTPKPAAQPQPKVETVADRYSRLIGAMPAAALPGSSANGTEEVSYAQLVLSKLAKAKKEGRYQGTPAAASVSFELGDQGEVVKVEIVRPSGDKSLDEEAIAMVKRGAPYPPPPPGGRRDYTITLRFQAIT